MHLGCLIPSRLPQIEVSCRKVLPRLGVEIADDLDFSCCPNTPYLKPLDQEAWITVAARNLCLAEEAGLEMVSPCPGCTNTLIEAKHGLDHDQGLKEKVNERLKTIDMEYKGSVNVRHLLQAMIEDIGLDMIKEEVVRPIPINAATHYGCHLLKPSSIMGFEEPYNAHSMEDLIEAVGGTRVEQEERELCCGMVLGSTYADGSMELAHRKLMDIKRSRAQALIVTCPTCFLQFDTGQLRAGRKYSMRYDIPVLYFTQLIGLSMGMTWKDLGTDLHRVKPLALKNLIRGD